LIKHIFSDIYVLQQICLYIPEVQYIHYIRFVSLVSWVDDMSWVVATKFNAFYIAENLSIKRIKEIRKATAPLSKRWAIMSDCWKITRAKKLFYATCSVDMRYVLVYGELDVDPEKITFNDLEKKLEERRRW